MRTSKGWSIFWPTSVVVLFELIGKYCMLAGFNQKICFPLRVICLSGCRNAFSLLQKAFSYLLMVQLSHLSPTPKADVTLSSLNSVQNSVIKPDKVTDEFNLNKAFSLSGLLLPPLENVLEEIISEISQSTIFWSKAGLVWSLGRE